MISSSHLKNHGVTGSDYKKQFPGAVLRIQSEESKEKIRQKKTGVVPWNKGTKTGPNEALSERKRGVAQPHLRGLKRTDEQRARISAATKNAMVGVMTDEVKQKLSDSISKRKQNGTYVAPMTGKQLSSESREKISAAQTGEKNWTRVAFNNKITELCARENLTLISRTGSERSLKDRLNFSCNACSLEFSFNMHYFSASQVARGNATESGICPNCHPRIKKQSQKELELLDFIRSHLDCEIVSGSRSVIPPQELDIYIPSLKIAIEFNGLYWHSESILKEAGASKHKDYQKYLRCKDAGIRMISIFEDEWDNQRSIVESRLSQILKFGGKYSTGARKCEIREIGRVEKDIFLNANHIQKTDRSGLALGAFHGGELVAVMTFSKTTFVKGGDGSSTELSRFAVRSGYSVPGIASRLLSHYRRNCPDEPIISYSDNRWSDGNVYEKLGFKKIASSPPGYFYIDFKSAGACRIHRSNFMKHTLSKKFKSDIVDKMLHEGASEVQVMNALGYDRIWDCGTTKWMLE